MVSKIFLYNSVIRESVLETTAGFKGIHDRFSILPHYPIKLVTLKVEGKAIAFWHWIVSSCFT